jgi:UPF0755 protein
MSFMSPQKIIKRLIYVFIVVVVFIGIRSYSLYHKAFVPNITVGTEDKINYLYIPTGSTYNDVMEIIKRDHLVSNQESFEWTARKKKYENHVYPGRYKVKNRMSNNELINKLRSGQQDPLNVTFNNIRTLEELSKKIATLLEINPYRLLDLMNSKAVQSKYGFNQNTMICMFVPNTYEFYWNTSEEKFLDRMFGEYKSFWNRSRNLKAENMKMSKEEIITLASIVDEETKKDSEKAVVAGVYINRLKKGIRLQADPTIIYAIGNFSIKRVLRKHYEIDSPYNTYMYGGLPPGPICIPEISSIDAVLNYEDHDYLYFCAKPDFSGYHNFSKTLEQHNRYAQQYRRELNRMRVYH